jgi:hypothetical protein
VSTGSRGRLANPSNLADERKFLLLRQGVL